ncbi:MAG: Sapep family Mn(2+)-dependent dipeptidase [Deltaproteobacteria bacterium]|nr:Sapep family Mn(2+)-dependent dipeptidase [Deltaproteobacteria bacterium]
MMVHLSACASVSPEPHTHTHTHTQAQTQTRAGSGVEGARRYLRDAGLDETEALIRLLVRFPTVRDTALGAAAPNEPAFREMAAFLKSWSEDAGLTFNAVDGNEVWEISFGEGTPELAFVMHADVVPPGDASGWTTSPYEATRVGERIYGRGTEDDKGAIAALLVVMRTLKRFGVTPGRRVVAVLGTGEESDWSGMKRYASQMSDSTDVISVDAGFPVVFGENGFVAWKLRMPTVLEGPDDAHCLRAVNVSGGEFLTQVPGEAWLDIESNMAADRAFDVHAAVESAVSAERGARGEMFGVEVERRDGVVRIVARGKAVHSSIPEEGHNALWPLSRVAGRLPLCRGGIERMMTLVRDFFDGDDFGVRLGVAYADPMMGRLVVAPTVLRFVDDHVELAINMRRPAGRTDEAFHSMLDAALAKVRSSVDPALEEMSERYVGTPHVADHESHLVHTLLDVYRELSGDRAARPISIRGGTYARLFKGAVNFGPSVPELPYRGHAPDEYIERSSLSLISRGLFEAIVRLSGPKTRIDELDDTAGGSSQPSFGRSLRR